MRSILLATLACILLPVATHAANVNLEPLSFQIGTVQGTTLVSAVSPDTIVTREQSAEIIPPTVQTVAQAVSQPRGASRPAPVQQELTQDKTSKEVVSNKVIPDITNIIHTITSQIVDTEAEIPANQPQQEISDVQMQPTKQVQEPVEILQEESIQAEKLVQTTEEVQKTLKEITEDNNLTQWPQELPVEIDTGQTTPESLHSAADKQKVPWLDYLLLLIAALLLLRIYYKLTHNQHKHD